MTQGRFVNQDVTDHTAVAVLGSDTAAELFSRVDPVGQTVNVNGVPMTVIGVLNSVGSSSSSTGSDQDDQVIVPIGQTVTAGSTSDAITIINSGSYQATGSLTSTQAAEVKVGDQALVTVNGKSGTLAGTVSRVGPVDASSSSYTYPLIVLLSGGSHGIAAGSTAQVQVVLHDGEQHPSGPHLSRAHSRQQLLRVRARVGSGSAQEDLGGHRGRRLHPGHRRDQQGSVGDPGQYVRGGPLLQHQLVNHRLRREQASGVPGSAEPAAVASPAAVALPDDSVEPAARAARRSPAAQRTTAYGDRLPATLPVASNAPRYQQRCRLGRAPTWVASIPVCERPGWPGCR